MFSVRHNLLLLFCAIFLSACSGGGGGGGGQNSLDAPPTNIGSDELEKPSTNDVLIYVSPSLPNETTDKIANIASPFNSQPSPTSLEVDVDGSLVVASDSESNLLLAGILSGDGDTINETSTAIALVWLMLSASNDDRLSNQELLSLIESNKDFPKLVELVTEQLSVGLPPLESEDVVETVLEISVSVSKEIEEYLQSPTTTSGSFATAQSLPLDNELYEPYKVVSLGLVSNLSVDENVVLENTIPSTFSVSQKSPDDETLIAPTVISSSNIDLDPFNLIANLVKGEGVVDSILGTSKLKLLDDQSFALKVDYNQTTAAIDIGLIFRDVVSIIIPLGKEKVGECTEAITGALLPGEKLIELAALGSFDAVVNDLIVGDGHLYTVLQKVKNGTSDLTSITLDCFPIGELDDNFLKTALKSFEQIMKKFNTVNLALSGGSLAARIGSFIYFVQQDQIADVTVCLDQNRKITNCAYGFTFSPARTPVGALAEPAFLDPVVISAGATVAADLSAFDKDKAETLLPISLDFTDKNNIDALSDPLLSRQWSIKAGNIAGSGNITITDTATDVSSTEYFDVINPVFHGPDEVTISIDEEKTFRLVHPSQRFNEDNIQDDSYDVFHSDLNLFEFSSDNESVQIISQTSERHVVSVKVKGISDGEATITARNRVSGHEEKIKVAISTCADVSAPVIQSVELKCIDSTNFYVDVTFTDEVGILVGSGFGAFTGDNYPTRLWFDQSNAPGEYQFAANSYSASLWEGDDKQGVVRISDLNYYDDFCEPVGSYDNPRSFHLSWKVGLLNQCGLETESNPFGIVFYYR